MYKSLLVFLLVTFVASGWARSTMPFVFEFPESWETNEIDPTPAMNDEKRLALQTNEVRPSDAVTAVITEAIDESDSEESEEPQNDQPKPQPDSVIQTAAIIDQEKAPATVFQYVLEFLYGLGQWFYQKYFA